MSVTRIMLVAIMLAGCMTTVYSVPTPNEIAVMTYEQTAMTRQFESLFDTDMRRLDSIGHVMSRAAASWCSDTGLRPVAGFSTLTRDAWESSPNSPHRFIPARQGETVERVTPGSAVDGLIQPGDVLLKVEGEGLSIGILRTGHEKRRDAPVLEIVRARPLPGTLPFAETYESVDTLQVTRQFLCSPPVWLEGAANAFTDGRNIAVLSGMLDETDDNDELAFVIAHEMAHVSLRHVQKSQNNRLLGAVLGALVGGTVDGLLGTTGSGRDLAALGAESGTVAFSMEFEREADYVAVALMVRAGFDPAAGVRFWERLLETERGLGYSSTHPSYVSRALSIQLAIETIERCTEMLGGPGFLTPDTLERCRE